MNKGESNKVSTAIATQEKQTSLVEHVERNLPLVDYSREQLDLIKEVYAKGATDAEFRLFVEIAKRKGLDIFSKQIFLVKRYDSTLQKEVMTPQTGIDGFRVIADQHPKLRTWTKDGIHARRKGQRGERDSFREKACRI